MSRPRLLDLFCGAGGASAGYHRAGFEVVGVDLEPQPRYPFEFVQADALSILRSMRDYPSFSGEMWRPGYFAAIHSSPPCQDHVRAPGAAAKHGTGWLLAATRDLLLEQPAPWVIENVPGAPLRPDLKLCGCMFGLRRLERERWFETSWRAMELRTPCHHPERVISVTGHGTPTHTYEVYGSLKLEDFRAVMGIGWMNRTELSQAIPPAYTEHIGGHLLEHLAAAEGAA